jgi:hypothetical protein
MTVSAPTSNNPLESNPLESATNQLRDICREHEHLTAPFDAGSLARMLVHIANINHSVLLSTRDHLNASKRLHDFALTLERIARHFALQDEALATRMTGVAKVLRSAGDELTNNDAVPRWQAPVAYNS